MVGGATSPPATHVASSAVPTRGSWISLGSGTPPADARSDRGTTGPGDATPGHGREAPRVPAGGVAPGRPELRPTGGGCEAGSRVLVQAAETGCPSGRSGCPSARTLPARHSGRAPRARGRRALPRSWVDRPRIPPFSDVPPRDGRLARGPPGLGDAASIVREAGLGAPEPNGHLRAGSGGLPRRAQLTDDLGPSGTAVGDRGAEGEHFAAPHPTSGSKPRGGCTLPAKGIRSGGGQPAPRREGAPAPRFGDDRRMAREPDRRSGPGPSTLSTATRLRLDGGAGGADDREDGSR